MEPHAYLSQALSQWEREKRAGAAPELEQLCASHPELLDELRRRVRFLELLDQHAKSSTISTLRSGDPEGTRVTAADEKAVELQVRFRQMTHVNSGGLGDVFQARDADLGRAVAIKFLKKQFTDDPFTRTQFLMEAEITSQLDHPGVVPIFGFGLREGQPFYVMRFLSGGTLQQALSDFHNVGHYSLTKLKALVGHFRSACETVAYAHNRGIVHCDLKPGNILLGKFGETLVADWGSALTVNRDDQAKASGEETLRPQSVGDLAMTSSSSTRPFTPAYMSPEQIPDSGDPITPASDIYSLGATLYHVITGKHQLAELYDGKKPSRNEIFVYLQEGQAPRPRAVNKHVPPALEAICRKAMALSPSDRYANALDLARDLEAWRTDGRVSAYQEPAYERLSRGARRHPLLAQAGVLGGLLALLLTLGAAALFFYLARSEGQAKDEALAAKATAEAAKNEALSTAARFAAEMLGLEIDLRWRILESLADDKSVAEGLKGLAAAKLEPDVRSPRPELQKWLEDKQRQADTLATSWLIVDAKGRLIARAPFESDKRTYGKAFNYRDYFHGQGSDLDPAGADAAKLTPIRRPYRSVVYRSVTTSELLLTFSVPVWAGEPHQSEILGVMGMSVQASKFSSLQPKADSKLAYSLVDFRDTKLDKRNLGAAYIHHPSFGDQRKEGQLLPAFPDQIEEKLRRAFGSALRPIRAEGDLDMAGGRRLHLPMVVHFEPSFADPLAAGTAPVAAAFAPVLARSRNDAALQATQLVVIVQDQLSAPAGK